MKKSTGGHRRMLMKWGAGLLSLYMDGRLRKSSRRKRRPLDVVVVDLIMRGLLKRPQARPFGHVKRSLYEKAAQEAVYWHGTGRLQYGSRVGTTTIDVFSQLLEQGGLRPFKDIFDVKQGEMVSTSLARQRMYARVYADMHLYKGARPERVYGSPRFWAYYFIMAVNLHAIRELGLWSRRARRSQETTWREQGKKFWTVKVTKHDGESVGQFFDDGSDIPGNYPILIGLKKADYHLLKTAAYVARYECRIGGPIPISWFTHLEVPASKVTEITALLKKYGYGDLPVFALEQCEVLQARKHFSALVS